MTDVGNDDYRGDGDDLDDDDYDYDENGNGDGNDADNGQSLSATPRITTIEIRLEANEMPWILQATSAEGRRCRKMKRRGKKRN